jgi:Dehydratase family
VNRVDVCQAQPIKEKCLDVKFNTNQRVVYPASTPISDLGGAKDLIGRLAPKGAIVTVAKMPTLELKTPVPRIDRDAVTWAAATVVAVASAAADQGRTDGRTRNSCNGSCDNRNDVRAQRRLLMAAVAPYTTHTHIPYAAQFGQAGIGAVTHAGGKAEVVCHADI